MSNLDAATVRRRLGLPDRMMDWLGGVERPAGSPGPVLPDDAEAVRLLERLGVQPIDRAETLAARPDPDAHPALWWVLDRAYHDMLANMGRGAPVEGFWGWPGLPASTGTLGRHLYVWLYLAVLPGVRRYHADRGIPDDASWAALAELGREMAGRRGVSGVSGLGAQWMLPLAFRGAVYELGRLTFNRGAVEIDITSTHLVVRPLRRGEAQLNTHVPERGRLAPAACDESFARAREFFLRHFPDEPVACFMCHSWLLDEQLAQYLQESSNIVRFQRRFHLLPDEPGAHASVADGDILELVFHRAHDGPEIPPDLLDGLPQDTTLQRAYVAHLRAGGHWYARSGWFPF